MREIKFRAWDKNESRWETFSLGTLALLGADYYERYENWCEWTGLKDKNGKEIYEGDIFAGANRNVVVSWWKTGACWNADGFGTLGGCTPEVIGNVFENPELISKEI